MPTRLIESLAGMLLVAYAAWGQADIACQTTADWGTGFTAQVTITNRSDAPIPDWALQFDLGRQIDTIWNARIVKANGSEYMIAGLDWDSAVPAKAALSFGINGSPGN